MYNIRYFILCFISILLLSIPSVFGVTSLGLKPPIQHLTYGQDSLEDLSFTVLPVGDDWVKVFSLSDLKEGIVVLKNVENVDSFHLQGQTKVIFDLNITENDLVPGEHKIKIYAAQTDPPTDPDGNPFQRPPGIRARAAVAHVVKLFIPHEGKFLKLEFLEITPTKVKGKTYFRFRLSNVGKEKISDLIVNIDIFNKDNVKVGRANTPAVDLKPLESQEAFTEWDVGDNGVGQYKAVATAVIGDDTRVVEKNFLIGDILIEINDVSFNTTNNVGKINVGVGSQWNEPITDIYVTTLISVGGSAVADVRSENFNLQPWETKDISLFFEKANLAYGLYDAEVSVHYAGKTTTKQVQFYNTKEAIIEKPLSGYTTTNFLLAMIVLLLVFVITMSTLYLKELRKK